MLMYIYAYVYFKQKNTQHPLLLVFLSEILKKCSNNPKESSNGEKNGMKNRTNKKQMKQEI